jgi:hypothetical protein
MNADERSDLEARLRALPAPPVPDGLEERLLASIAADLSEPRRSPWLPRIGAMAVAACLLVAVCLWFLGAFAPPSENSARDGLVKAPAPAAPPDLDLGLDSLRQLARVGAHDVKNPFEWPVQGNISAHPRDGEIAALLD